MSVLRFSVRVPGVQEDEVDVSFRYSGRGLVVRLLGSEQRSDGVHLVEWEIRCRRLLSMQCRAFCVGPLLESDSFDEVVISPYLDDSECVGEVGGDVRRVRMSLDDAPTIDVVGGDISLAVHDRGIMPGQQP